MAGYRKLGKTADQRRALLRGLVTDTLKYGKIETTVYRAKETKRLVDKMITLGKKNDLAAKRRALSYIYDEATVYKLFDEIAPKYENRKGGYTRLVRLGTRRGDGAETAILELVEE
ncbi:MAG: 50S ribosomal protein L17 [Eubacteriaceae bacterium]|nr:50S ribosomal protein L17 [Eubacteriaceae bacterium]MBQ1466056.1 50S ribosomal protein L17 [Eubacteriaceae bacterium]MBR2780634.1 50S ribosomal protein L17 [Eubacteriaceae bacterium]MCR4894544.1 50S ribosomal protein L17 [Eubacteriales bacterium]